MASLVDVNLLLAILHARHLSSPVALRWLERQDSPGSVVICRMVQMGTLRILTRPSIMKEDVLHPAAFWECWVRMMEDDRFHFAAELADIEADWRSLTTALPRGQCAETDAYLAAFAISNGLKLATFDRGFRRFAGLDLDLLTSARAS